MEENVFREIIGGAMLQQLRTILAHAPEEAACTEEANELLAEIKNLETAIQEYLDLGCSLYSTDID